MDMGDVPAWVALFFSVVGVAVSYVLGKRSADAAKDSAREAQRSSDAAERSAVAAEDSLALQREEAEERRRAAAPKVRLVVEHVKGDRYRVRNAGDAVAQNVRFLGRDLPYAFTWPSSGVTIPPDDSHGLRMPGASGKPIPVKLLAQWDGQPKAVPLSVPPRR
ncbi:hypothetical protein [Streptomyces sp. Rer75]|nr:hypothetical protein [Streptomyces sp. Rer75]QLH20718.1 hypothetical protein HYQ63_08935 [Streptomyces sp. Rer75]